MANRIVLWTLLAAASASGCSPTSPAAADAEQAREAVCAGLEAWKHGETPAALQQRSPAIHFRDRDWASGWRLKSYRFARDDELVGLQRRCCVQLVLHSPTGKTTTKDVQYLVDTSPALVVGRLDD